MIHEYIVIKKIQILKYRYIIFEISSWNHHFVMILFSDISKIIRLLNRRSDY